MAASAVRVFAPLVLVFLTAVVVARLLLAGPWGWIVFGLSAPVLLVVLGSRVGFGPAAALVTVYAGVVLLFRFLLLDAGLAAVIVLLLVPVLLMVARLAWNVVRALREGPEALGIAVPGPGSGPDAPGAHTGGGLGSRDKKEEEREEE